MLTLCQSIGVAAIHAGFTVYYRSIFDTVRDLLHDEAMEVHEKILQRYLKPDLTSNRPLEVWGN